MFQDRLRQEIDQRFNGEDLRLVAADLGLDYDDDLIGRTKDARILSLVQYIMNRGRMEELLLVLKKHRPNVEWPDFIIEETNSSQLIYRRDFLLALIKNNRAVQVGLGILSLAIIFGMILLLNPDQSENGEVVENPSIEATEENTEPLDTPSIPSPETEEAVPTEPPTTDSPTSTSTPDVVIFEFEGAADPNLKIARRIEGNLIDSLDEYNLEDVTIEVRQESIESVSEAKSIADELGSKVVVWGWYDSAGVNIHIFSNDKKQTRRFTRTDELPLENSEDIPTELALLARDTIPQNISFISFFIIGQISYQDNNYQNGFRAFDAAASNLPENVIFTNEALFFFFDARLHDYGGSDDFEHIVCGYAMAINADPEFVSPYVNLSTFLYANPDYDPPECVDPWNASSLILKARMLEPGSALIQFNSLVMDSEFGDFATEEDVQVVQELIELDPSIPGAYLLLARLTTIRGDWQIAIESLETAVELMPETLEAHFNLGQIYVITGDYENAKRELEYALSLDETDQETVLALANLAMLEEQYDDAAGYLAQITNPERPAIDTPPYLATMLASRIEYENGDLDEALKLLESLIPEDSEATDSPNNDHAGLLVSYLLANMYEQAGNSNAAENSFQLASEAFVSFLNLEDALRADNQTSELAWKYLDVRCDYFETYDPNPIGKDLSNCAPDTLISGNSWNLEDHIIDIYDALQLSIANRFKNLPSFPFGMACPFVFTFDSVNNRWHMDTTIIFNLVGPESEQRQQRPLSQFDGRIIIRELEPEISYLDQIYVLVIDSEGNSHTLNHNNQLLQNADNNYYVMNTGDSLSLDFPDFENIDQVSEVWIVAEGYYVPLHLVPAN